MIPATDCSQPPWTLRARWIFPVSGPPLANGILTITGEHIVSVEPSSGRSVDVDLGEVAILPGLVNAHTHLDLSGLRGECPPSVDFTGWLQHVIAHRRFMTAEQVEADIRAGLAESLRHGTTLLGDISAGGISWSFLAEAPLRSVVFYELLGLTQARADQSLAFAREWLVAHPATDRCRPGLSPHAPYSVRMDLFTRSAKLARRFELPLSIHLAETRDELELLRDHRGAFVPFLKDLSVWDPSGLAPGTADILKVGDQRSLKLFVHGNYLEPSARIPRKSTIIYCPRTHAAFGHEPHPFPRFLKRGIRIALGTDGLASNPDLSILAEVRHLHRHYPDVPGEVLLRMATLCGAEALGWASEAGSLEAGKSADLIIVPLTPRGEADPYLRLLDSDLPVIRVLIRGRWLEPSSASPSSA
jgi:cytosine/adenosine deaminase-related metal-dependent hydrolase